MLYPPTVTYIPSSPPRSPDSNSKFSVLRALILEHGGVGEPVPSWIPALAPSFSFLTCAWTPQQLLPIAFSLLPQQLCLSLGATYVALPSGFCTCTQFLLPPLFNLFPITSDNQSLVLRHSPQAVVSLMDSPQG